MRDDELDMQLLPEELAMSGNDVIRSFAAELLGAPLPRSESEEKRRIQEKQGGHHMPPRPEDDVPLDDTDRNTDKIIKPGSSGRPS